MSLTFAVLSWEPDAISLSFGDTVTLLMSLSCAFSVSLAVSDTGRWSDSPQDNLSGNVHSLMVKS